MAGAAETQSVPNRLLDGVAYMANGTLKLTSSAVIVMSVATILWAGAMHMGWISPSLPHFGDTLPYVGPITQDLALMAATISSLVLATLFINSRR